MAPCIADHLRAALGAEGNFLVRIHEAVIALVGRVEVGIACIALVIEIGDIHDHAAERRRMPVDVFARGVDDDVGAELARAAEDGRCERVVDDE